MSSSSLTANSAAATATAGFYTIAWLSTEDMLSSTPPAGLADALQGYKTAVCKTLDDAIVCCQPYASHDASRRRKRRGRRSERMRQRRSPEDPARLPRVLCPAPAHEHRRCGLICHN